APRSLPRSPRDVVRSRRRDRADLRAGARRRAVGDVKLELRRLELTDLDAIERIERAPHPPPWSGSIFPPEIGKPSSLSFGAIDETGRLVGYLVLSRYVDAWHVMNVAVAPERRRQGIASALLRRLPGATRNDAGA